MSAWHGFNMIYYAVLVFLFVPAGAWWVWFFWAIVQRLLQRLPLWVYRHGGEYDQLGHPREGSK